ncbi:hypothetical protein SAMN05444281_1150 [Wenyingzhuangia marina]|uniref:Uncharacterized protein n=1 Tax=Wenyingzhuangia marina TaxID=1195760 RepID=A0A1M5UBQ3_9FLAO|nr:hypothetical protein SAMN05444281_1150 [Wenyingzhuangia marina]
MKLNNTKKNDIVFSTKDKTKNINDEKKSIFNINFNEQNFKQTLKIVICRNSIV